MCCSFGEDLQGRTVWRTLHLSINSSNGVCNGTVSQFQERTYKMFRDLLASLSLSKIERN
jgi:hypothetical protein